MEKEIWKDIPNYEGIYKISNLGRVKSLERFKKGKNDSLASVKEKILKPSITRNGYYQVCLWKQSTQKHYFVHRLVWEAFNGKIPEGIEVNHIDENPLNNKLENLNLLTHTDNINWGTRTKRAREKATNGKCSKKVLQYNLEGIFIKEYPSIIEVERQLGFLNSNIVQCCKGKYKQMYGYIWKYKGAE